MAIGKPGESAMARAEASRPSSAGIRDGGMRTNGGGQASNFGGNGGYSGNSGNFGSGSMAAARASDRASVAGYSPASRNFTTPSGGGGYAPGLGAAINAGLGLRTPAMGYSGPKGVTSLNPMARMASVTSQGFNVAPMSYTPKSLDLMTRIALAESSAIKNKFGAVSTPALQGVMDVMRNRMLSPQFPNTLTGVLTQKNQFEPYGSGAYQAFGPSNPNYAAARSMAEAVLRGEAAPTVGGAVNFGNNAVIQGRPTASQATQRAFAAMEADPTSVRFADATNPSVQHTFGALPGAKTVDFGAYAPSKPALASAAATAPVRTASRAPVFADMGAPLPKASAPKAAPTGPTPITTEAFVQEAIQRLNAAGANVQRLQVPQVPQVRPPSLANAYVQPAMARMTTPPRASAMRPLAAPVNITDLPVYEAPQRSLPANVVTAGSTPIRGNWPIQTATPAPRVPLPPNANIFDMVGNMFEPANLFPNAKYTQVTPEGSWLEQQPENRGVFKGYMSVPYRVERGVINGQPGVPEGYTPRFASTGMPDPNANMILFKDGGGIAFDSSTGRYEPISRFRGTPAPGKGNEDRKAKSGKTDVKSPGSSKIWQQAALNVGYTEDQLKDPEIAALIKQLYDMGFLETNTA